MSCTKLRRKLRVLVERPSGARTRCGPSAIAFAGVGREARGGIYAPRSSTRARQSGIYPGQPRCAKRAFERPGKGNGTARYRGCTPVRGIGQGKSGCLAAFERVGLVQLSNGRDVVKSGIVCAGRAPSERQVTSSGRYVGRQPMRHAVKIILRIRVAGHTQSRGENQTLGSPKLPQAIEIIRRAADSSV